MNFKFTPRKTAIFVAAIAVSGMVNALVGTQWWGFGIMVCTIAYLARSQEA